MSYFFNSLVLLILSITTVGFLPYVTFFNTVPILPLSFIIALSYLRKGFEPILLATLTGFFLDVFTAPEFGFYTIFFLLTSILIRIIFYEGIKRMSFFRYMIINSIAFLALFIAQVFALYFIGTALEIFPLLLPFSLFILLNLLGAIPLYFIAVYYFDKMGEIERKRKRV